VGIRGLVILAASGALCAGALTTAPAAGAKPPELPTKWRVVAHAPNSLAAAVAPTASSAWAFGWGAKQPTGPIFPVTQHWNGHRWASVKLPSGVKDSGMSCAGASSPDNVWAFSGAGAVNANPPDSVSALRLNRGHWTVVHNFPHSSFVTGCNVISPGNVWAFGGAVAGLGPPIGTWHFNGSGWREFNTGKWVLFNASVVSPSDIWATAGNVLSFQPGIERWNGRSWRLSTSIDSVLPKDTKTRHVGLDDVNAISSSDVWVLATVVRGSGLHAKFSFLVVHWDGRKWSRVKPGSAGYYLPTAVPDGHGSWWSPPYVPSGQVTYLLHRTNGRWVKFSLPVRLEVFFGSEIATFAIINVPHTSAMLVAGTQLLSHGTQGVVLAFGRL
jgi:hypothetical protein